MKLSIIIPVYNEETTIRTVIDKVNTVKIPCKKEIVVVNDGSTDATSSKIKNLKFLTLFNNICKFKYVQCCKSKNKMCYL